MDPYLVARRVGRSGIAPADVRTKLYDHPLHGVVVPAYLAVDHVAHRIALAVALMGPCNALGGWASLHVHGNHWFDGREVRDGAFVDRDVTIHCLPGSQLRVREGIAPTEGAVRADEIEQLSTCAVTTMARAVYDEMRNARDLRRAVVALDMAISGTSGMPHTTLQAVLEVVDAHHKTRGIAQARKALALASDRSASPLESRTRLVAQLDVGIEGLLVNVPVFSTDGAFLGVVDLIDPRTGLVVETDGAHHREADQHAHDNVREEKLERAGLVVCRVTSIDLNDQWAVVGRIAAAHRDAERSGHRGWTLAEPDWWATTDAARRWA